MEGWSLMNCEICGNETFSDSTVCEDCKPNIPKPAKRNKSVEVESVEVETVELELHRCENTIDGVRCDRATTSKYGNQYLCEPCKMVVKTRDGATAEIYSAAPLEVTNQTYDPDNFANMTFEQVYQKIFNDYAPRVAELSDEAILQRIIYHRRAQEIDKALEGIVLGEREKRIKTRRGRDRDALLTGGIQGTKVFTTKSQQEESERAEKRAQASKGNKVSNAVKKMVATGMDRSMVLNLLGLPADYKDDK
jgi:hypothetical protein